MNSLVETGQILFFFEDYNCSVLSLEINSKGISFAATCGKNTCGEENGLNAIANIKKKADENGLKYELMTRSFQGKEVPDRICILCFEK